MLRSPAGQSLRRHARGARHVAAAIAVLVHVLGALGSPPYRPEPYRLRAERVLQVVEAEQYVAIAPPKPISRPPIPEIALGSEDTPDVPFPDTTVEFGDMPPLPGGGPEEIVAFARAPVVVRSVEPVYPDIARRAEAEGRVVVVVVVDATGRVREAHIVRSTAIRSLENAALDAARRFLFQPALQRDQPVACRVELSFQFSLRGRGR